MKVRVFQGAPNMSSDNDKAEEYLAKSEEYLAKIRDSGLMAETNEPYILAVAEMMKNPLTLEEKRAQVAKGSPELVRYKNPPILHKVKN